jgi:hypothetical protein
MVHLCNRDSNRVPYTFMVTQSTRLFMFESAVASYIPIRRGLCQLKPSDLVSQYSSGPPYDFLAKTTGVNTFFYTDFHIPLSSLTVH